MRGTALTKDGEARLAHGIGGIEVASEAAVVERAHPHARRFVVDRPQAHDHRARAGDLKRASQPEHALTRADLTQAGIARGEHGPLRILQIETRDLLCGEDAVVLIDRSATAAIGTSHREAREEQRILELRRRDGIGRHEAAYSS